MVTLHRRRWGTTAETWGEEEWRSLFGPTVSRDESDAGVPHGQWSRRSDNEGPRRDDVRFKRTVVPWMPA